MAKKMYKKSKMGHMDGYRMEDSGMIKEDRSAIANLPQKVIMKEYPRNAYIGGKYIDDTSKGIDSQIYDDVHYTNKSLKPEKY